VAEKLGQKEGDSIENSYEKKRTQDYVAQYMQNKCKVEGTQSINLPSEEVSGDFHLFAESYNSRYVLVADACGHGLSSILPALHIPKIFTAMANKGLSILTIADEINTLLYGQNIAGHFVAVTIIHMDFREGYIEALNCGNPSAFLVSEGNVILHEFRSNSLALGIVSNDLLELNLEHFKCDEASKLYIGTDGLVDTLRELGSKRVPVSFKDVVKESKRSSVGIFSIVDDLLQKALEHGQADDITFIEMPYAPQLKLIERSPADLDLILNPIEHPEASSVESVNLKNEVLLSIDKDDQKDLVTLLERIVGRVLVAKNEKDSTKIFLTNKPSLIIVDSKLLEEGHWSMLRTFLQHDPNLSIIISHSAGHVLATEKMFEMGVSGYLKKPFQEEALENVITRCLHEKRTGDFIHLSSRIFNSSSLAMTITDKSANIIKVNDAFLRISGYREEEVIGRNPRLLSSGKQGREFYRKMWEGINSHHHWSGEIWNKRRNGELFLEWITINAITNDNGEVVNYISVFSDITERRATEEAIHKLTFHDPLTSLPNRRLFLDRLNQKLTEAKRSQTQLALLFVDLDHFKDINDTLGHDVGDIVLKELSIKLLASVGDSDAIARFGGDEFTICLTGLKSTEDIDVIAQSILKEIKKPFTVEGEKFYLSASIGIALSPGDSNNALDLIKHADQAMFACKQDGRNGFQYFKREMHEKALLRKDVIKDLHSAITNNEFIVYYQPIVDLATGQISKAEALIRWEHPTKGFISPVEFIPIAEEAGMINEIGDWVFKHATAQAKAWQNNFDIDFQVAINKSPKEFQREDPLDQKYMRHLAEIGLSANSVVMEITEGLLMESNKSVHAQLMSIRAGGTKISLDDFGTGYSSLAYLKKFAIDYLKIDRSFVSNLSEGSDDLVLCEAMIVMAHKLEIQVVAEGIETKQQKELLQRAGCDFGQGYLFSRPVPSEEFEGLLAENSIRGV